MENKRKGLKRTVPAAIGIGVFMSVQFAWADTRIQLSELELDTIHAGAAGAVAAAVGLGFGTQISGVLAGTNTGALNVTNGIAGVSSAGAGAGVGAGGDGGGAAATTAATGAGPASVGVTMGSGMGSSGPGGIATGISTSLSIGINYPSLL